MVALYLKCSTLHERHQKTLNYEQKQNIVSINSFFQKAILLFWSYSYLIAISQLFKMIWSCFICYYLGILIFYLYKIRYCVHFSFCLSYHYHYNRKIQPQHHSCKQGPLDDLLRKHETTWDKLPTFLSCGCGFPSNK